MNAFFKTVLTTVVAATVVLPSLAMAQKSSGGVTGGARLRPGTWDSGGTSQYRMRSQPTYRNSAPVVTRSEQSAPAVAQAPSERRSFSYDPAEKGSNTVRETSPCGCVTKSEKVTTKAEAKPEKSSVPQNGPATAERSTQSRRSFSYEPSTNDAPVMERSYSAPRQYSSGSRGANSWSRQSGSKAERNNQRN